MPFKIVITEVAERQLQWLTVREQRILEAAILTRLKQQPDTPMG
jgi:mRNA-degrading endonuclease RelE of RelBE toxin-antitoxin system